MNSRDVNEDVCVVFVGFDEVEVFVGIEEFYSVSFGYVF